MGEERARYPEKLYRFRSDQTDYFFEELDHAISNCEIFLAPLLAQNDPFEARPRLEQGKPKQILEYVDTFEKRFGRDTLITGTNVVAGAFARGYSPKRIKSALKKQRQNRVAYARLMSGTIWKSFQETRNSIGIACFSEDWRSLLMWSHYCSGHRGICIEFETISDMNSGCAIGPVQMEYQRARPIVTTVEAMDYLASARLADHAPDFFDQRSNMETLDKLMMIKSLEWAYEKEWRFLAIGEPRGYSKIQNLRVSKIIVGANTCERKKSEILRRYGGRVKIFKTRLKEDEYGLLLEEL